MDMDEIEGLLEDLDRFGTFYLKFTGGECTLHPRFWEILESAAQKRYAITVLTNTLSLEESHIETLSDYQAA